MIYRIPYKSSFGIKSLWTFLVVAVIFHVNQTSLEIQNWEVVVETDVEHVPMQDLTSN